MTGFHLLIHQKRLPDNTIRNENQNSVESDDVREFLEPLAIAKSVTLYSIDPTESDSDGQEELQARNSKPVERLHGFPVLGKIVITDKATLVSIVEQHATRSSWSDRAIFKLRRQCDLQLFHHA